MTSQHDINQQQYTSNSQQYLQSTVHATGKEFSKLHTLVQQYPNAKVLDLGCGAGHVSYQISAFAHSVIAYDLSPQMLKTVGDTAKQKNLKNIKTQYGAAEKLPFADASFDIVISRYSAHHWQDVNAALKEIYRILKPKGQFVLIDILGHELPLLDTHLQSIERIRDPSHVRNYSLSDWIFRTHQHLFMTQNLYTFSLDLNFQDWVKRMQVAQTHIDTLLFLQQQCSDGVKDFYSIQTDGSFTSQVLYLVASKNLHLE